MPSSIWSRVTNRKSTPSTCQKWLVKVSNVNSDMSKSTPACQSCIGAASPLRRRRSSISCEKPKGSPSPSGRGSRTESQPRPPAKSQIHYPKVNSGMSNVNSRIPNVNSLMLKVNLIISKVRSILRKAERKPSSIWSGVTNPKSTPSTCQKSSPICQRQACAMR